MNDNSILLNLLNRDQCLFLSGDALDKNPTGLPTKLRYDIKDHGKERGIS